MVVVYLKNGEKAPMPDANYVRLEAHSDTGAMMLRCRFGDTEVGEFKWDEVAGYTIDVPRALEPYDLGTDAAWERRLQ